MNNRYFLSALAALALAGVAGAVVSAGQSPERDEGKVLLNAARPVFNSETHAPKAQADVPVKARMGASGSTIYGFQTYASEDGYTNGFAEVQASGEVIPMWTYQYSSVGAYLSSGWLKGEVLCALGVYTLGSDDLVGDYAYQEFDASTGQMSLERRIDVSAERTPYFSIAAYVPEQDLIYGFGKIGGPESPTYAFKVAPSAEPEKAEVVTEITPGDRCYSFCWHPADKCFYGVNTWGKFVKILTDGTITELFDVPVENLANSLGALAYSPYDGYLLWNPAEREKVSKLYAIYPDEKKVVGLGSFDTDHQFSFFLTPDFDVDDAAPAKPTYAGADFKDASHDGSLSFVMPATTFGGETISDEMGWTLYVNGKALKNGKASASDPITIELTGLEDAEYTFRFEASLDGKAGVPCVAHLYVGNDAPAAPADVVLSENKVTWSPVTTGAHGGYIDVASVEYRVSLNDEIIDTTAETSLSFNLGDDRQLDAFHASVVAICNGKESAPGISNKAILGQPMPLPVTIVPTPDQAELVTIVNRDGSPDYGTWRYSEQWDSPCFASGWSYERADDWLILPATSFPSADVAYSLALDAARGGSIGTREYFEVWAGNAPTPEAMTIQIMSKTRAQKYNTWTEYSALFAVPEPGTYYVAIHGISDPDQKDLIVKNIRISATESNLPVPEKVSEFEVSSSSDADLTATLSFKMPAKFTNGTDIPAATEVKAIISAATVTTVTGVPGSDQSVTVATVQGDNYITVTPEVNGQRGQASEEVVFTGDDMLGFVENYKSEISEDNMSVHLTWEAPVESLNGGYFSRTDNKYWIAVLDTDATIIGDPVCAGTDVFEYTLTLPEGTPQQKLRIAVIAENRAGLSNARWYIVQIMGTPYELPMIENFDNMTFTYNPMSAVAPSSLYTDGSWTWCQPELVHPDFANTSPYALIGYTDAASAKVRMRLPKASTAGLSQATATFELWTGHSSADDMGIYAITYGMDSPEKIAILPKGDGWDFIDVEIPEKYLGRPWMNLYIDGSLPSSTSYLILSSYSIREKASVNDIDADSSAIIARDGTVVLKGFDGQSYAVATIDGRIVARGTAEAETNVNVAPGIYIVSAGRHTARVFVR